MDVVRNSEQTFKGSDLDDSPVVTAFPHPNGVPEPVRAKSVAVVPYSLTAAPPAHVPFDWVKKYGLLRKSEPVPALPDIRPRAVKFADHAVHERIAHKVWNSLNFKSLLGEIFLQSVTSRSWVLLDTGGAGGRVYHRKWRAWQSLFARGTWD